MMEWGGEVEIRREGKGTSWCINKRTGSTGGQAGRDESPAGRGEVKK